VDVEKEVEFVKVNLMKGEHKQPGFLLKNVSLCCVVCLAPLHLELVEMVYTGYVATY
jgi:hypothetical protein